MLKKIGIYSLCVVVILSACTTKRNTIVHRAYHNLTARFNGYYYSTEAIKDGVFKVERTAKEDYSKVLPVFVYPTNESAKNTSSDFDRAIKKSSTCIQRHTIKDKKGQEIAKAGKWIDNNWINIGKSHFYKREFFSGIEAFDYVVRTYQSKDKYTALLWLAKSYNEIGAVSQSEPIISLLKNEKKLPSDIRKQLYAVEADYHIKRGLYTEAMTDLGYALRQNFFSSGIKRSKRARYAFITAQLAEQQRDDRKARKFYEKTIKMKPGYEMVLYSKIKLARISDVRGQDIGKIKKELLAMTREEKNNEYLDVIYYTLGEIAEKERATYQALSYYQKSVINSLNNPTQKARGFLKLGEINFDMANYTLAGAYYDSTVTALPKDHPEYDQIVNRKKTLQKLVGYITTIKTEDSLQRMAKLSDKELDAMLDKLILQQEEEARLKKEELERAQSNNQLNGNQISGPGRAIDVEGQKGAWYFYNPTTVSFGVADFQRKWGSRKLEDNWRRLAKALSIDDPSAQNTTTVSATQGSGGGEVSSAEAFKKQYKTSLPVTDSLLKISDTKIIDSYYLLGSTYKEDLNNSKKSIEAFEELNKRYATHKHLLSTYYQLYRICLADRKQEKSDYYKEKILTEYPNSEYAKLIQNPKYAEELNVSKSEVEKNYSEVYRTYASGNYNEAHVMASAALGKYGKTDFTPKYEFIKALCIGKLKPVDSLEMALKQLVALYPKSEVTPKANDILQAIKRQKNPQLFTTEKQGNAGNLQKADTFKVNLETEHMVVMIIPDDPAIANDLKNRADEFNREYYSNKALSINSNLFGEDKQMVVIKSFVNGAESHNYVNAMKTDTKYIKGEFKRLDIDVFSISGQNLPMLYQKKNVKGYLKFYEENYTPELNTYKKPN